MQSGNGALKTWPGSGEELFWVSAHALFTLAETRSRGFDIPQRLVNGLADFLDTRLDSMLSETDLSGDDGEYIGLACLAMAKSGHLKRSWLLRLEEIAAARAKRAEPLPSAALARLVESVAAAGDVDAAKRLYDRFRPGGKEAGVSRNRRMDLSAWLSAAEAVGAEPADIDRYAVELADIVRNGYASWSTSENAMALASLGRHWRKAGPVPDVQAEVRLNGDAESFSTRKGGSWAELKAGTRLEATNPSDAKLRLFWLAEGIPAEGKAVAEDRGIVARRTIFDRKGNEIVAPYKLKQGESYEIRLAITGNAPDLAIADLLPAGLEIEDASLKGLPLPSDAVTGLTVKNVEIKDDRLLVFAGVSGRGEYRYLARAVAGGTFAWPGLDASRMYDPEIRSVTARSELTVTPVREASNDN